MKNFLSSNWFRKILWSTAFCILLGLSLHVRLFPLNNQVTSENRNKASLIVISQLRQNIAQTINQQAPRMPAPLKQKLLQERLNQVMKDDNKRIRAMIENVSTSMSTQHKEEKQNTYLLASDSYYFMWLTKNIFETGSISSEIKNGQFLGERMLAPIGQWEPFTAHPYVGFAVTKIIRLFKPDAPLMYCLGFTPLLIFTLTLLIFFLIGWQTTRSVTATSVGGAFLSFASIYLRRSTYAWYDSDPYNVFFPLLIILLFVLAFKHTNRRRLFSLLCALACTLYSMFWQGWLFSFGLIMASGLVYALFTLLTGSKKESKQTLWICVEIALGTLIGLFLFRGPGSIYFYIHHGIEQLALLTASSTPDLWPNLFIGVGELKQEGFSEIIALCGGMSVLGIALIGLSIRLFSAFKHHNKLHGFYVVTFTLWLLATTAVTLSAHRFAILMLIPLSILCTLAIKSVTYLITKQFPNAWIKLIMSILPLGLIIFPTIKAYSSISTLLNPIFNIAWERALTQIKEDTPDNSIVNTWWTPGHFVKAVAERSVTFDGASIKSPQAYWLTQALMSPTEQEALNYFRLLNTSSNQLTEYLTDELAMSLPQALELIHLTVNLNKRNAQLLLKTKFTDDQAKTILDMTHGTPLPSSVMIFDEMIQDPVLMSLFHKWNFSEMQALYNDPAKAKKIPPRKSRAYIDFMWQVIGGSYRYSLEQSLEHQTPDNWIFGSGIIINKTTKDSVVKSPEFGQGIPQSIVYLQDGYITEKTFENATLGYSVVLYQDGSKPSVRIMDLPLARSMLIKLYFLNGSGFKHFAKFVDEQDLTGQTHIKAFHINWNN